MSDTDRNSEASVPPGPGVPALLVDGVRKAYGKTVALDGVDLRVEPGTILGLLGPNGAGKTSLVSIVAGLRRPDAGRVEVCGIDVVRVAARGARPARHRAPGDRRLPPAARARQPALLRRARRSAPRRGRGAHRRGRGRPRTRRRSSTGAPSQLSGGERRRLHTAIALLHRPALVLLDEPTTGADVRTRTQILDLVRDARATRDRRSCTRRTTSRRSRRSAPTSRSSTGAASSRAAASPSSSTGTARARSS